MSENNNNQSVLQKQAPKGQGGGGSRRNKKNQGAGAGPKNPNNNNTTGGAHNNNSNNNNPSSQTTKKKRQNKKKYNNRKDKGDKGVSQQQSQEEEAKKKTAAALAKAKAELERKKKEAEEAYRIAETQFLQGQKQIIEERRASKQAIQDSISNCLSLVKVTTTRSEIRQKLLSDEQLKQLRKEHIQKKKTLKSDIKKCTAFCRKVKTAQFDSSSSLIKDIQTLNLARYVEEVAQAVMEAKLKMPDIPAVLSVCIAMHERYEDFLPALLPKLISVLKGKSDFNSSSGGGDSNQDDGDGSGGQGTAAQDRAKEAAKQRRMCLKLVVEFLLNGLLMDAKPIVKVIAEAAGAPSSSSSSSSTSTGTSYSVTDPNMIVSFAKAAGHEILGNPSKSLRRSMEILRDDAQEIMNKYKKEEEEEKLKQSQITEMSEKTKEELETLTGKNDNTQAVENTDHSQEQSSSAITPGEENNKKVKEEPSFPIFEPDKQPPNEELKTIDTELYELCQKAPSVLSETQEILDTSSQPIDNDRPPSSTAIVLSKHQSTLLGKHVMGAYQFFCTSLVTTHQKLLKLEKRCEQDRLLVGTLSENREKGLGDAKKLLESIKNRAEALAEALDLDVPDLYKNDKDDPDAPDSGDSNNELNSEGVGLELWTKENEDGDDNLGPFDDEETRSFYCDITDLLTTIPPALLGYTQADVDRIQADNIQKYGAQGQVSMDGLNEDGGTGVDDPSNNGPGTSTIDDAALVEESNTDHTSPSTATGGKLKDLDDESEGDDTDSNKDTPHYKLTILLEQELPECNRRELCDLVAEKFCNNHATSKPSFRRLGKALFLVPRTRLDLLPYYARLTATLQRVFPAEIGSPLVHELEAQFHGFARWKKNQNLEGRIKNARFLGELTKFRVAPPIVSLRCLKRCLDDFSGFNIDVCCCLLESCGKYLYRLNKHTNQRITNLMDTMMRIRKAKNLYDRSNALIESAFYMVVPPTNPARKQTKVLSPMDAYLKYLLMDRLTPEDSVISFVAKQLQRLPWSDAAFNSGQKVCKYMLKACRKGRYLVIQAVAEVAATLRRARPEVATRLIDSTLEELQWFMENPTFRDQQRVVTMARLLGELHNAALVPTSVVFEQLHHFLNYGHDIPDALRDVCEKHLADDTQQTLGPSDKSAKLPPSILPGRGVLNQTIMEGDEEEDEDVQSEPKDGSKDEKERIEDNGGGDQKTEPHIVLVAPSSLYDPRVPSATDPPNSVSRVKLVSALLESITKTIVVHSNLPKLHRFLASFQRYLFTKSSLPTEVEFSILDLFDGLDSQWRGLGDQKKDSNNFGKNRKNGAGSNGANNAQTGFTRYSNWLDAHNATVAAEEAEAIAEAKANARLLAVGGSILHDGDEKGEQKEDIDEDEFDEDEDEVEESDEDISITGDSDGSLVDDEGHISQDDSDDEDYTDSSTDSDASSDDMESDSDESDDDDDDEDDDEEEELDEQAAQEAYMRQLEEEAFERELRKITMEAIEKGKVAARTGSGGKIADTMVHASHFVVAKKSDSSTTSIALTSSTSTHGANGNSENSTNMDDRASKNMMSGINFKLLKRGHKGRVEAKHFLVPSDTNLAKQATKQDEDAAREREALKARVLQYEAESACGDDQYHHHSERSIYDMDLQASGTSRLQLNRNRPLSMEVIDRNFGSSSSTGYGGSSGASGINDSGNSSGNRWQHFKGRGNRGGRGIYR